MKRERTLLEFAIGASLAVVPVLLAVLLIVAWWRPIDAPQRAARGKKPHTDGEAAKQVHDSKADAKTDGKTDDNTDAKADGKSDAKTAGKTDGKSSKSNSVVRN